MNHVMFADDICLMAPSSASLRELLIYICYDFSVENVFNSSKSFVWCLSQNHISYHVLFYI